MGLSGMTSLPFSKVILVPLEGKGIPVIRSCHPAPQKNGTKECWLGKVSSTRTGETPRNSSACRICGRSGAQPARPGSTRANPDLPQPFYVITPDRGASTESVAPASPSGGIRRCDRSTLPDRELTYRRDEGCHDRVINRPSDIGVFLGATHSFRMVSHLS